MPRSASRSVRDPGRITRATTGRMSSRTRARALRNARTYFRRRSSGGGGG